MIHRIIFIVIIVCSLSLKAQIYTPNGTVQGTSPNDNVGIGTNSPTAKLSVKAGINGHATPLKAISIIGPNWPANANSAQSVSWDFTAAGSAAIRSYRGSSWDTYMEFLTNSNISAANSPQVRMHISENGHVGIGTTNPSQKFVVSNNGAEGFEIYLDQPTSIVGLQSYNRSSNAYAKMQFDASQFAFMYGNVGIGTLNPDEKLTVKGKIHTQEVRVDMSVPLAVPDYVFAKDYNLKTLNEVEQYIKQNNHLPEIPSAKEIEKNGLMLAEMNMSLLKKIEELTLYMIELKKENDVMKNKQIEFEKAILKLNNKRN